MRDGPAGASLVVRGRRVLTPDGIGPASVHVRDGVIVAVSAYDDVPAGCAALEAGEALVMPALVDPHVHVNEPGRAQWEGFETATRAAAAGGVTTLIDMPLNSIPATTTPAALRAKRAAAEGKLWVDVGFWAGLVPDNLEELGELHAAGAFGFKCFGVPSGVPEFGHVSETELRAAMRTLSSLGALLLFHAELSGPIEAAMSAAAAAPARRHATWLASRPPQAEDDAVELLTRLCRELGAQVHVVHLSSAGALGLLRQAKRESLPVSVETCPHYLAFAAEDIRDGSTEFKCAPPIRERENRERLWSALADGTIDLVASDHSPCPPDMKAREDGDFLRAWGGIASLQLGLPVVWTAARERGHSPADLVRWLSQGPARLLGLAGRKGAVGVGYDADIVVWDPDATFRVEPAQLHHRHKLTPYAGRTLAGVVQTTLLRGRAVYHRGDFPAGPVGALLQRPQP